MHSYTFHITLYGLAFLGIIFIGLNFAVLLWFTKNVNRSANRFLALALGTMILWMVRLLAIDIRLETYLPGWDRVPMQFLLALGPLMYLYVLKITRPQYKFGWRDLLHFAPVLLEQGALALEIKESTGTSAATYATQTFKQLNPVLQLLIFISVISYLYLSYKLIERFYTRLKPVMMDRSRLEFRWLRRLLTVTALLWLLWIFCAAVDYFGYHHQLGAYTYYPFYIFFAVMIIWTAAAAFLRPQAALTVQAPLTVRPLIPSELREKGILLKRTMEANLYYQDPELSLSLLAEKLKVHTHELSRIINTVFKKSFNDFINEYRVRDVISKMQDQAYDNITLIGIAFEAGFNSKATFNRTFKQITGKSPAEFKNNVDNKVSSYHLRPLSRSTTVISNHQTTPMRVEMKLNRNYMFTNYVKIAWRNLIKNKVSSFINISGLTVGMAVGMLIGLWIWDELSFDKYHENYESIVRVMQNQTVNGEVNSLKAMPQPVAYELRQSYSNDFKYVVLSSWTNPHLISFNGKTIPVPGNYMQQEAPEMLTLKMAKGARDALKDPTSMLLSESASKAVFGDGNPVGKIVKLDGAPLKVAGVYHDLPLNTSFNNLAFIAPWKLYAGSQDVQEAKTNWNANSYQIFAQVVDSKNIAQVSAKIKDVKLRNTGKEGNPQVFLFPMSRWHLYAEFKNGINTGGSIKYVWLFGFTGIFILMLAGINFMNLSTAHSEKRGKEVGIRKAIGSSRGQLILQFLSESLLLAILAFVAALVLVWLTLPFFNTLTGKHIAIVWTNPLLWLTGVGFAVISGLFAGSYPAFYLSSFRPLKVLKGSFKAGPLASMPRKVLIVIQFTFSVTMIIGTVVVLRQVQFAKNRAIGYGRSGLIMVRLYTGDLHNNINAFKNDLLQTKEVISVAESGNQVTKGSGSSGGFSWPGKDPRHPDEFAIFAVSPQYGKTVDWQLTDGRDFSTASLSDSNGLILNQAAAKYMGLKTPVGKTITWDDKKYTILGVIKDMIVESPYEPIKPTIFHITNWAGIINIRLNPVVSARSALNKIEAVFKKYAPAEPFDYKFADQEYAQKFGNEERIGTLASFFAGLAIFISCLGLFGLASFVAEQRKKEIGVRKVLGASTYTLWQMLSKEFAWLVIISCFIATPLAWYYLNGWLQQYNYRTSISVWVFVASGVGALVITLITVSFQAIKAALANPVKSLRSE